VTVIKIYRRLQGLSVVLEQSLEAKRECGNLENYVIEDKGNKRDNGELTRSYSEQVEGR
jgi:hypothetical protein